MYETKNPYRLPDEKAQLSYAPMQISPEPIAQADLSALEPKAAGLQSQQENAASAAGATKQKSNIGNSALSNADGIGNFALGTYDNFKNVSSSNQESTKQTIGSTVQGASLGLQVAGPWGALIGAAIGAGVGLIDGAHDNKVRIKEADKYHRDLLEERKAQRKKDYQLSKGKQASNAKGNILGIESNFKNPYS